MDRRERMNDLTVAQRAAMRGFQATIWTALPGIIQSFDASKMTATVQPAIKAQQRSPKGEWSDVTLPLLLDVPVIFPSGGGFALTVPLKKDDEGIVVFASRCIDSWWQSGGVQTQAELRMHDLSDGMFIPGLFSQPNKLADFNAEYPELRNKDATIKLTMAADGFRLKGNLIVEGNLEASGTIKWPQGTFGGTGAVIDGVITATGDVHAGEGTLGKVTLKGHTHTSGAAGTPTSAPTPGT